jgi:hypothetical protein
MFIANLPRFIPQFFSQFAYSKSKINANTFAECKFQLKLKYKII